MGDHVALLTNADDWDHGFRVFEVRQNEIVLKKANIIERVPTRDAGRRLKTDVVRCFVLFAFGHFVERPQICHA